MALIGSGRYGCVYHPPLCLGEEDGEGKNLVGKVSTPFSVRRELEVATRIRKEIPGWEQYYGLLTGSKCPVKVTDEMKKECYFLGELPREEYTEVNSYSSPYLGVSLREYTQPITTKWLWDSFSKLITGIALLHAIKIYHMDINDKNILVDKEGHCRLIDFGLAFVDPTLDRLLAREYGFYRRNPLFYNVYETIPDFGLGSKFKITKENPFLKSYYATYEHLATFYYPHYQRSTATDFIQTSLYIGSRPRYLENIVLPNIGKVDLYQLADTFNDLFIAHRNKKTLIGYEERVPSESRVIGEDFPTTWTTLINGMLHLDVNQQWTLSQVLSYIYKHQTP